jgi:dihydroflavonol-4-reductase
LFFQIADAFGKKKPSIKVNKWMSELAWRIEAARSFLTKGKPFVTRETAMSSQCQWFYSNEKIRKELKMEFKSIKQSIMETCQLILQNADKIS